MPVFPSIATMYQHVVIVTISGLLCLISRAAAQTTEGAAAVTMPATSGNGTSSNETVVFSIAMSHHASSTSSITVQWKIPRMYEQHIDEYVVKARKKDSDSILRSPSIEAKERLYEVEDLMTNSHYKICVYAYFKEGYDHEEGYYEVCRDLETLAIMRNDSVIALIVALGYILLMVIIGYLCWRCAHYRSKRQAEESASGEEAEELLEKRDDSGQQLLAPPPQGRPRSSIEEELPYIPYITPPLDELERDRGGKPSRGYSGAANNI